MTPRTGDDPLAALAVWDSLTVGPVSVPVRCAGPST